MVLGGASTPFSSPCCSLGMVSPVLRTLIGVLVPAALSTPCYMGARGGEGGPIPSCIWGDPRVAPTPGGGTQQEFPAQGCGASAKNEVLTSTDAELDMGAARESLELGGGGRDAAPTSRAPHIPGGGRAALVLQHRELVSIPGSVWERDAW